MIYEGADTKLAIPFGPFLAGGALGLPVLGRPDSRVLLRQLSCERPGWRRARRAGRRPWRRLSADRGSDRPRDRGSGARVRASSASPSSRAHTMSDRRARRVEVQVGRELQRAAAIALDLRGTRGGTAASAGRRSSWIARHAGSGRPGRRAGSAPSTPGGEVVAAEPFLLGVASAVGSVQASARRRGGRVGHRHSRGPEARDQPRAEPSGMSTRARSIPARCAS